MLGKKQLGIISFVTFVVALVCAHFFLSSTIISYIFRIVNFVVLIILGTYVFKKYIVHGLLESIKEQHILEQQRAEQQKLLMAQSVQMDCQMRAQEAEYERLCIQVARWKEASLASAAQDQHVQSALRAAVQERRATQQRISDNAHVQHVVIPQAIASAREALQKKFRSEHAGSVFLGSVLINLKKSSV